MILKTVFQSTYALMSQFVTRNFEGVAREKHRPRLHLTFEDKSLDVEKLL